MFGHLKYSKDREQETNEYRNLQAKTTTISELLVYTQQLIHAAVKEILMWVRTKSVCRISAVELI